MLKTGATMVLVVLAVAVLGPLLVPFDTSAQDLAMRLTGPARAHMLGLDELGRDILARVIAGARISLFVGVAVVSISACVGTVVGAVAGYFGGIVDDVIS